MLTLPTIPPDEAPADHAPIKIETVEHVRTRVVMMPRGAYGATTKTRESRVTLARVRFTEGADPAPAGRRG